LKQVTKYQDVSKANRSVDGLWSDY